MKNLKGKRIAIISADGFEESELFEPKKALENSGAHIDIVSLESGVIKAWKHGEWSKTIAVDVTLDKAKQQDYDALVIPGGVINPDKLRREKKAIEFVKSFFTNNKPVAAICHGPQLLIEAEEVKGRKLTSFFSIKTDLINAGANWVDQEVVVDKGLITSRNPDDLEAFSNKIIEVVAD